MTGKERFIKALKHEPIIGHVPHFELVFYLTMEVLAKVHPEHRSLHQWQQMSVSEKELQLGDIADCYIDIAKKYEHDGIFVHLPGPYQVVHKDPIFLKRLLEIIREKSGDKYFLMIHGDSTYSIPNGDNMIAFTERMYEDAQSLKDEAMRNVEACLEKAYTIAEWAKAGYTGAAGNNLLDGFGLCADYCLNANPFFTQEQFAEFITPYLKQTIDGYRNLGFYSIKHTDGNIMPILDQMLDCGPDALHSLDPQGGVDLKYMKEYCGEKVCLIGNVNCGLLQTGTDEEVRKDTLRSLRDGMPGYGYVFSTSNCIYTGMELKRYELMHGLWREFGEYNW